MVDDVLHDDVGRILSSGSNMHLTAHVSQHDGYLTGQPGFSILGWCNDYKRLILTALDGTKNKSLREEQVRTKQAHGFYSANLRKPYCIFIGYVQTLVVLRNPPSSPLPQLPGRCR